MKKLRLIPILLALSLTGCLAGNGEQSDDQGKKDNPDQVEPSHDDQNPGGDTNPDDGGQDNPPDDGGDDNPPVDPDSTEPVHIDVDYTDKVKLSVLGNFSSYDNKTLLTNHISKVTLKSIIDGDTIHFYEGSNSLKVRLFGVDAPETSEELGKSATDFVKQKLQTAKTIVVTNDSLDNEKETKLDSTGDRYLANVWYSEEENAPIKHLRCLNIELIVEGFSSSFFERADTLYVNGHAAELVAKNNKRNKWQEYVTPKGSYGYNTYLDGDGNSYYGNLTWENSVDLKQKLYTIIHNGYNALPYSSPNWETNQFADQDLYNHDEVNLVYSTATLPKTFTSKQGNGGWQREHAFCASLMTGQLSTNAVKTLGRATDFHNLFAASENGNTSRGNKDFGFSNVDVEDSSYQSNDSYTCDSKNFEPSDFDKGRLARAIFYMGVMYSTSENEAYKPLQIVEDYVTYDSTNCEFAIGNLKDLLLWNYVEVDRLEYQHNQSVYSHVFSGNNKAQGNRNPFVDYPQLVDYVYGDKKDQAGDLANLEPSANRLHVENESTLHYAVKDVQSTFEVGDTFNKDSYTLLAVDMGLREKLATEEGDDLTPEYTFKESDLGTKTMTVQTRKNKINVKVNVVEKSDNIPIDQCKYYSGAPLTKNDYVTQLANAKTTLSLQNTQDVTISQYAAHGIKIPNTAGTITLTSEELENITQISIKTSSNKGKAYTLTIKVDGVTKFIENMSGVGTGTNPLERYVLFETPISGVITITITNAADAVYIAALGINAD